MAVRPTLSYTNRPRSVDFFPLFDSFFPYFWEFSRNVDLNLPLFACKTAEGSDGTAAAATQLSYPQKLFH